MSDRILEKLEPVRRRQCELEIVRFSAMGLLAGSLLAAWSWASGAGKRPDQAATGMPIAFWAAAILVAGPVLGAVLALVRGRSSRIAAAAVDAQYGSRTGPSRPSISPSREIHAHAPAPGGRCRTAPGIARPTSRGALPAAGRRALRGRPRLALALGLLLWPRPTLRSGKASRAARVDPGRRR